MATGKYSEEAADAAEGVREIIRGERKRFLMEYPCFSKTNPDRWFNLHACNFKLGERMLYIAAHEDITHVKRKEAALRETERKYKLLDENVTDMISVHDRDGTYSFVSHSVKTMLGYTPEEMIGKSAYDFFHPDDISAVSHSHNSIMEAPQVSTVSYRIRKKDRSYLWVETTSKVVLDSTTGEIAQVIAVTRDISERKKAEELLNAHQNRLEKTVRERTAELQVANNTLKNEVLERVKAQSERKKSEKLFKMLIENIPVATYIKDAEGRYVEVNTYYTKIAGYSYDEIIGRTDFELYNEVFAREYRENDLRVMEEKKAITFEEHFSLEDREQINISVKFPLQLGGGEVYSLCGISMDITDRKKLEKNLIEAKEKAEEANRAKGAFLANITHELLTPIHPIIGLTDILLETELEAEQMEYVGDVKRAAEKLMGMVQDLVTLSRIESEGRQILREPFSSRELIDSVLATIAYRAREKSIAISSHIDGSVPEILVGDVSAISQILDKLLDNAVKFTESGAISVVLEAKRSDENDLVVRFSVQDTGVGIPKEKLERVFSDFSQGDDSTTRKYSGIGLGLTMVRKFITLLGGTWNVESTEGEGTVVTFSLPVQEFA
jgi:PAS domain S-box-containing protein